MDLLAELGRSPHGERGLKSEEKANCIVYYKSLPPRGAWIEILDRATLAQVQVVAPPAGSVD